MQQAIDAKIEAKNGRVDRPEQIVLVWGMSYSLQVSARANPTWPHVEIALMLARSKAQRATKILVAERLRGGAVPPQVRRPAWE